MTELNRREFAGTIALAALAPLLGPAPGALRWPAPAGLPAPDPSTVAKALAGVIRAQYGDRLSEADLATVTRQIEAGLERAGKVRKVALANGDEPDFVFSAIRSDTAV
ncbi:MAG TPA: hypothetical protein VG500_17720 [Gemmatimonadales bacterium]|nr:hypothetical protein [Gemmatimonadales bacterium]